MSGEYQRAIRAAIPDAQICFDPFHVVRLGARATDNVRRDEWNRRDRSHTPQGKWVKGACWSLLKAPANQTVGQRATLHDVQQHNKRLYRLDLAPAHLDAWLAWASGSRLKPFTKLARTIRYHREGILAAIELGLSNGHLEGFNSKIRLISHRAYGFPTADALIAPHLPMLHRHHDRTPTMALTPDRTERHL